jgi:hypothetical protein
MALGGVEQLLYYATHQLAVLYQKCTSIFSCHLFTTAIAAVLHNQEALILDMCLSKIITNYLQQLRGLDCTHHYI